MLTPNSSSRNTEMDIDEPDASDPDVNMALTNDLVARLEVSAIKGGPSGDEEDGGPETGGADDDADNRKESYHLILAVNTNHTLLA